MLENSRYAPLFESVRIGPVTAPNRLYQVPHCTGMGHGLPQTLVAIRGMKAEGGWGGRLHRVLLDSSELG